MLHSVSVVFMWICCDVFFFFFSSRRRHTRSLCDWSSDVCSSDLLEANRKYYGAGPYLDRVIFKYIPDLTVMFTRFQTGDIDVTGIQGITVDDFDEARRRKGVTAHPSPSSFVEYRWWHLAPRPAQDK